MLRPLLLGLSLVAATLPGRAEFLVDYSPDTTEASVYTESFGNQYGSQIVGGRFTLEFDSTITGASIFSQWMPGMPLADVRILIFDDPSSDPIIDFLTTLDAVDSLYTTTQTSMRRKYANFEAFTLEAGTYWFAMPSTLGSGDIMQGTGLFGDNLMRMGETGLPYEYTTSGKPFMQIEGSAVPEPATTFLLAAGGCAILIRALRRRK